MAWRPKQFGLFARLLILCLTGTVLVVTVGVSALHKYRAEVNANQLAVQLANTAQSITPAIVEHLGKDDKLAATRSLRVFAAIKGVRCAEFVVGGEQRVAWPQIGCRLIAGDAPLTTLGVHVPGDPDAAIRLFVDQDVLDRNQFSETVVLAGVILIVILSLYLVLTISFRSVVLRPLELLKHAMVESTPRGPVRGEMVHDDEIGALVKVYNKLVAGSRLYIRRLDQSQASLEASEKRFRDLAEVSGDWFFEMDAELRLSYVSDRFFELTGLEPDDVLGHKRAEIAQDLQDNKAWQDHLADLEAHREFRKFEYQVRTKTGVPLDVSLGGVPQWDDKGNFAGYRGVGSDVSELKEKERLLAEANRNFGDSVAYASTIQRGLLPSQEVMSHHLGQSRTIWQPKDVVGGDFYWVKSIGNVDYLVFYDCTGHGVPGAFMTLIVTSVLDQIAVSAPSALSPSRMLQLIHDGVCNALNITADHDGADGLDCAVIRLNRFEDSLDFAGASIDLFSVAADGILTRHRGKRVTLGYKLHDKPLDVETVSVPMADNAFVVTTDGLLTQVGEETKRVLGTRRFSESLESVGENAPAKLLRGAARALKNWQGREERRDDVSLICFKPNEF